MKLVEFVQGSRGKLSITRLTMLLMVCLYIFMAVWKLVKVGDVVDIPLQLAGFLAILYGTNTVPTQIAKAIEAYITKKKEPEQDSG
mgnify:CR=1 FL=1